MTTPPHLEGLPVPILRRDQHPRGRHAEGPDAATRARALTLSSEPGGCQEFASPRQTRRPRAPRALTPVNAGRAACPSRECTTGAPSQRRRPARARRNVALQWWGWMWMWGITLIGSGSDDKRHSRALHHQLGGGRPVWLRHLPLAKHGYELAVHALSANSHRSARVSRTDGPVTHRARSRIVPTRRVSRPREKSSVMEQDHHEGAGGVLRGATSGGGARRRDSADPGRRNLDELFEPGRGRATSCSACCSSSCLAPMVPPIVEGVIGSRTHCDTGAGGS